MGARDLRNEQQVRDLIDATGKHIVRQIHIPKVREGNVNGGTWNAAQSTIGVTYGDTAASGDDVSDSPVPDAQLSVGTFQVGDQYAPIGNESAILIPIQGSEEYLVLFKHQLTDSPGAPAGERWICHRNASGKIDAFLKHTNDGSTPGDGKGGAHVNGGDQAQVTTSGGHTIVASDTHKAVTTTTAGGMLAKLDDALQKITHQAANGTYTIVDGAGNAISHVAAQIGLGAAFGGAGGLDATHAAFRNSDASVLAGNIMSQTLQSLAAQMANAMIAAGVPNAAAFYAIVNAAGWVLGNVTVPTIPNGSSVVRISS